MPNSLVCARQCQLFVIDMFVTLAAFEELSEEEVEQIPKMSTPKPKLLLPKMEVPKTGMC